MKIVRNVFSAALLLLICAGAALAQSVQTDFDRNFNLARFKTFGFYEQQREPGDPLAASPINDRRIHDALTTQLQTIGLAASVQPDFMIAYYVTTRRGLEIQDNRFGLFQRLGNVSVSQVTEGTLVVIFVDSATRQEVWRGYASGQINPRDLDKDVNKAVTKLVQKFRKNQGGQR